MEAPPVITPARLRFPWLLAGGLIALLLAGVAVYFLFDPSHYPFYPRCIMYTTTGLLCPGCGSQRALYHLLHGHLLTALRSNLIFVVVLPLFLYAAVRQVRYYFAHGNLPITRISSRWIKIAVVVLILYTVLRNIPGPPFSYLTPP